MRFRKKQQQEHNYKPAHLSLNSRSFITFERLEFSAGSVIVALFTDRFVPGEYSFSVNFMLFSQTSRLQLQCLSYYNSKSLQIYR